MERCEIEMIDRPERLRREVAVSRGGRLSSCTSQPLPQPCTTTARCHLHGLDVTRRNR